jgi:hypothetical protein
MFFKLFFEHDVVFKWTFMFFFKKGTICFFWKHMFFFMFFFLNEKIRFLNEQNMILYEKYGCSYDLFKRFSVFHDFLNEHFIIVFLIF